jgi:exonuclease SbcC
VLDATIETLSHAFAEVDGWQGELEVDPNAFVAKWSARVEEARQSTQTRDSSSKQLSDIDTQLELQANALKQSTQHREVLDIERKQQASERDGLMAQRREVLQGRPAAEVDAALQSALKASEAMSRTLLNA